MDEFEGYTIGLSISGERALWHFCPSVGTIRIIDGQCTVCFLRVPQAILDTAALAGVEMREPRVDGEVIKTEYKGTSGTSGWVTTHTRTAARRLIKAQLNDT